MGTGCDLFSGFRFAFLAHCYRRAIPKGCQWVGVLFAIQSRLPQLDRTEHPRQSGPSACGPNRKRGTKTRSRRGCSNGRVRSLTSVASWACRKDSTLGQPSSALFPLWLKYPFHLRWIHPLDMAERTRTYELIHGHTLTPCPIQFVTHVWRSM